MCTRLWLLIFFGLRFDCFQRGGDSERMVPPGPPTPIGGAQSVPLSLLRSNSGMLAGQGGGAVPSQTSFPSMVGQRNQFNNMNMLGNMSNVTSLLNQSFPNGIPNSGLGGPGSSQRSGGKD